MTPERVWVFPMADGRTRPSLLACRASLNSCSPERLAHIDRIEAAARANERRSALGLGLFALSPVPSGQLFAGAGLTTVPLLPLTAAFFGGRLVSCSIYVGAASVAEQSLGSILIDALTSPWGLTLQIAMLVALALLAGGIRPGARPPNSLRPFPDDGPSSRT